MIELSMFADAAVPAVSSGSCPPHAIVALAGALAGGFIAGFFVGRRGKTACACKKG